MERLREQLRRALTRSATPVRFAWLGNFEVENDWQKDGLLSLPRLSTNQSQRMNDSMAELTLMLAGADDLVLLKQQPDQDYLHYLEELGWQAPRIVTAESSERPLAEAHATLYSSRQALQEWAGQGGAFLLPHGVSRQVEELSRLSQVPLAAASADVCAAVNSKLYSRRICEQSGIRQPRGRAVHDLQELEEAFQELKGLLGHTPLLLKEANGVSGKGIVQIEDERRFAQLLRLLRRTAEQQGTERVEMVLEERIAKDIDINYQFLLGHDGAYTPLGTLRAMVEDGKHVGHLHPHQLPVHVVRQIAETMPRIAVKLAADGYYGIVGVDALLAQDGTFYPCIEINARCNMSTYHLRAFSEWIPANRSVIARSFSFQIKASLSFRDLRAKLDHLMFTRQQGYGILVNAFAPFHALRQSGGPFSGRLYVMLVDASRERCLKLQAALLQRLGELGATVL